MSTTLATKLKQLGLTASIERTGKRYPRKKGNGKVSITVTGHFRPGDGFAFQFYPTPAKVKEYPCIDPDSTHS